MEGQRVQQLLLFVFIKFLVTSALNQDYVALESLTSVWQNTPPNWVGNDPCGDAWDGIGCTDSRVTSITLSSMRLSGSVSADIGQLTELQTLDLSYNPGLTGPLTPAIGNLKKLTNLILVGCGFSGPIPDSIGSLPQLTFLSLNSNGFTGPIPPSIGDLLHIYWLDLADNKLSGTIPVSNGSTPGLDLLVNTKHFHFGKNQLSGEISPQLFSANMSLIHVLFEENQFTGNIPSTIGLVSSLEVLRLDRNSFTGAVPNNINNLTHVNELFLSNNRLSGALPNLTGMDLLNYLDMSNNSFSPSVVPTWFTTLQSLTTLKMQNTNLRGQVPTDFFSIPQLQTVVLKNNQLNGTLDLGTTPSTQLQLIDMQTNLISGYVQGHGSNADLILISNPVCTEGGTESYCSLPTQSNASYSTPPNNCLPTPCSSDQTSSPNCRCAYPYSGTLNFRAPSFSDLGNTSIYTTLHNSLMDKFTALNLPVDSVSLSRPTKNLDDYLVLNLDIFPTLQDRFNRSGISSIGFVLSNQTWKPPHTFGPYFFIGGNYDFLSDTSANHKSSSSIGIIIGAVVGGCVLVVLLVIAGVYAFRQKGRAERADKRNSPFAQWDANKGSGGVPQLKGARNFSFDEIKKCTNGFSENIGAGGYGMVYRGTLPSGQMVAIKRAQQGSTQGGLEFKTEIELLSRVHHKNVVTLVGFCFDEGEQMLVYEFIANGTLKDSLSGRTGIKLDWMRRLRITLGAARGLQYLHDLADPPIIHRDVKSNNILLDERLNAKVADFGLSKPMGDPDRTHITTQVKGTMGYMDPEYYMTQQLTEKSDVYSFGVVMLELLTAKSPIDKGKYIVREVKQTMDKNKALYNLQEILDPTIGLSMELKGLEKYVDLALRCVQEAGSQRPTMSEVVKEIEHIMESAGFNPNAESTTTSASYTDIGKGHEHPYNTNDSLEPFEYSGAYPPSTVEPK